MTLPSNAMQPGHAHAKTLYEASESLFITVIKTTRQPVNVPNTNVSVSFDSFCNSYPRPANLVCKLQARYCFVKTLFLWRNHDKHQCLTIPAQAHLQQVSQFTVAVRDMGCQALSGTGQRLLSIGWAWSLTERTDDISQTGQTLVN